MKEFFDYDIPDIADCYEKRAMAFLPMFQSSSLLYQRIQGGINRDQTSWDHVEFT